MKAGIVTIFDPNPNYGNRLQNYAVHRVLLELGLEPKTLYVEKQGRSLKEGIKFLIHRITNFHFTKDVYYWKYTYEKIKKFDKFNCKYIPNKQIKSFYNLNREYDYFIIGSDQVWNPSWYNRMKREAYLLNFAKTEQKVCFSPSFGIAELPNEWKEYFKDSLNTFRNISVREETGASIVNKLIGKKAEVLIDPTLMLNKNEWIKVSKKPDNINLKNEYILTYFIGGKTKEQEEYIRKVANENNMNIYNLLDYNQPDIYMSDPSEFIYLINNSKIVFTDSFHACVFSFIFKRPFQVFPRNGSEANMMSRIENLLDKFSLQRKLYGFIGNDLFECDYSEGYKQLNKEQEMVIEFLNKSLSLKK
ncbi:polysaccharide pyruvyl transferase family protein [Clostridium beijerinckii]|uniref:polysaccharide pyruvyl transferase family protein n=1 Tax=Clostridium beijerinckii TaxID=1520 RepID=UPI0003D2E13D|nr:polysaccharide pyruvyl transferase family protein [Clostridium beijerinckii]AQS18262.1 polysaccharide pyruvyl transferase family protein [Clostridium beijerinckii NRRL B-598]